MLDQTINCIVASPDGTRPIHVVRPDGLAAFLDTLPSSQAAFLRDTGFGGKSGELRCLPGADGVDGAVLGIGVDTSPFVFGNLPLQLPDICTWRLLPGDYDPQAAILGYCLGAYRYDRFHKLGAQGGVPVCSRRARNESIASGGDVDGARSDQHTG